MSECFWCADTSGSVYHPTCSAPGCDSQVHGHGENGEKVYAHCPEHRGKGVTVE